MGTTPLEYARWRETTLGAITERLERAAVPDLAGPLAGLDVLDVGCGDGASAGAAARVLAPVDPLLGRTTRLGAAFIATAARRPVTPT